MSSLLRLDHRKSYAPRHIGKTFSQESGQVYAETLQRGGPMTSEWVWKTLGSSRESGRFQSLGPGCASLSNMAIRSVMVNLMSVTVENLQGVPWQVGKKLWERIRKCRLESVHIWKVFASVYLGVDEETLQNNSHAVLYPNASFKSYIEPLISSSFHWLTFLSISHLNCSRTDLLQLFQLTNLGVLTVGQGVNCSGSGIGLDDSIIRSWARAAVLSGSFRALRALNCHSQTAISTKILVFLNSFPALALFTFDNCPGIHGPRDKTEATRLGWTYKTGAELSAFFARSGATSTSWDDVSRASFRGCGPFSISKITVEGVDAFDTLPVLHFSFGNRPDAVVDGTTAQSLRAFYRVKKIVPPTASASAPLGLAATSSKKKRPLEEQKPGQASNITLSRPREKPTIKASKQQTINDTLMGFYT